VEYAPPNSRNSVCGETPLVARRRHFARIGRLCLYFSLSSNLRMFGHFSRGEERAYGLAWCVGMSLTFLPPVMWTHLRSYDFALGFCSFGICTERRVGGEDQSGSCPFKYVRRAAVRPSLFWKECYHVTEAINFLKRLSRDPDQLNRLPN
jgi:hypothetical protein